MIAGHGLLVGGVVLYALAGSALSRQMARGANERVQHRGLRLLLLSLGAALALACLVGGVAVVDGRLPLGDVGLPLWLLAALCVAPAGVFAAALVLLAVFPPAPGGGGGGGGGSGPDDLPPPPDPDGPDGWAAFEREFRAYAEARDANRVVQLVR